MLRQRTAPDEWRGGSRFLSPFLSNRNAVQLANVLVWKSAVIFLLIVPAPAQSDVLLGSTHLIDIRVGSSASDAIRQAGDVSYELADGTPVDLRNWYRSEIPEISVEFLTELSENFGLIWGFRSGEDGEKYRITPGIKIGFIYQTRPTKNSMLSISLTTQLGSVLSEDNCTADYGDIGGVQTVNCRLAASTLPPEETLKYNLSARGRDESRVAVQYMVRF